MQKTFLIRQNKIKYYEGAKTKINITQIGICKYLAKSVGKYGMNYSEFQSMIGRRTCNVCCKLDEINNQREIKKYFVSEVNTN